MTYKHCSTVRDLFLFLFLDYRGFIEESLEFLSFYRIFHAVLDEQTQVAVFFNHAPQFLFADSKIDGCLGYGQGILLTNSYIVFFQSLSSFLVPYLKSQFRILFVPGKTQYSFFKLHGAQFCVPVYKLVKNDGTLRGRECRKTGQKSGGFSTHFALPFLLIFSSSILVSL